MCDWGYVVWFLLLCLVVLRCCETVWFILFVDSYIVCDYICLNLVGLRLLGLIVWLLNSVVIFLSFNLWFW